MTIAISVHFGLKTLDGLVLIAPVNEVSGVSRIPPSLAVVYRVKRQIKIRSSAHHR